MTAFSLFCACHGEPARASGRLDPVRGILYQAASPIAALALGVRAYYIGDCVGSLTPIGGGVAQLVRAAES
jgi:hypothetical protein